MAQDTGAPVTPNRPLGIALLRGRITARREFNGQRGGWLTVIKLPAADEFTSPETVEVWSQAPLGNVETVIDVKVRVGGIARSWNREVQDNRTGELRKVAVPTADNLLYAV